MKMMPPAAGEDHFQTVDNQQVWFWFSQFISEALEITFENWSTLKPKLFDCRGVDHHTSIV